jgi:hypothetical protein
VGVSGLPFDNRLSLPHDVRVIRPDEQVIFFPTLARPIGDGRWDALLHGVLFRPELDSLKRKLLIRAIARAAGVRHDVIAVPRLAERLRPFLVDNKRRRTIGVRIGGQDATLGPSSANGHLLGRAVLRSSGQAAIEYATTAEESPGRSFVGHLHLLPPTGVSVICDIDDTIKHSNVPDTRDLLRNTFVNPYRSIDSVARMCGAFMAAGAAFHYVSASPWQLYPLLSDFLSDAGLPGGTFHLKTFRLKDASALALLAPPERFKLGVIEPLLRAWPKRRFVLVGDSAERDPEIYGELTRRHPSQVAGIVIRDITGEDRTSPRMRGAFAGVRGGCWELLGDDADWAAAAAGALDRATSRVR